MAKAIKNATATETGIAAKPKRAKPATSSKQTTDPVPKKPVKKRTSRSRAAEPSTLQSAVASLYDTATGIVSDRIQPTIDQIKALAVAVIGHEEKKARKSQAKASKQAKPKKAKVATPGAKVTKKKNKK